jgi:hypothetical protein
MAAHNIEWFEKKEFFKQYLDIISYDIQVINKSLLNKDYDKAREYVGYVENIIERERKTMEEYPEFKSPEIEKFLEESLNEAKAILHKCPSLNSNTTTRPWSDRYNTERESYQEKKARWDYEDSQRYQRLMEWKQQQHWFNH